LLEREISEGTGEVRGRFAILAPEPIGTEEIGATSIAMEPSGAARWTGIAKEKIEPTPTFDSTSMKPEYKRLGQPAIYKSTLNEE